MLIVTTFVLMFITGRICTMTDQPGAQAPFDYIAKMAAEIDADISSVQTEDDADAALQTALNAQLAAIAARRAFRVVEQAGLAKLKADVAQIEPPAATPPAAPALPEGITQNPDGSFQNAAGQRTDAQGNLL